VERGVGKRGDGSKKSVLGTSTRGARASSCARGKKSLGKKEKRKERGGWTLLDDLYKEGAAVDQTAKNLEE